MAADNLDLADIKAAAYKGLANEDVMQQIFDISEIPLPFTDSIGTGTATNSYTEFTQDRLQDVDLDNAKVDGADTIGDDDSNLGARVGARCQISTKTLKTSTRAREADTIGQSDMHSYQLMQRGKEIRRDVEAIMLTQQGSVEDDGDTIPGKAAGIYAWATSSTFRGVGGSDGGFSAGNTAAPTPGTPRAISEKLIRDCAQSVWELGGDPTILTTTPTVHRLISEYMFTDSARIANLTSDVQQQQSAVVATGSVNVFITDFGVNLSLIPNRLHPEVAPGNVNALVYDPEWIELAFLHGYREEALAKTGLADKTHIIVDWTLKPLNQEAYGVIADIDDTAAMVAA